MKQAPEPLPYQSQIQYRASRKRIFRGRWLQCQPQRRIFVESALSLLSHVASANLLARNLSVREFKLAAFEQFHCLKLSYWPGKLSGDPFKLLLCPWLLCTVGVNALAGGASLIQLRLQNGTSHVMFHGCLLMEHPLLSLSSVTAQ